MPNFNGQLRSNEIFAALFNMIISQHVFADNISSHYSSLVDKARVDGSLYGDTKLYYSTDVLKSAPWGNDAEAANLLALSRPMAPKVQAIYIDQFRQISLTVDDYLSKRAWSTPDAFSSFNSVMMGWIRETKKIYDTTLYNAYIGTAESQAERASVTIVMPAEGNNDTSASYSAARAKTIATELADLLVEIKDISRDFNDYGYLRGYDPEDLVVVWNAEIWNEIKKTDLASTYFAQDLIDKFDGEKLPARYFGTVNTNAATGNDLGTIRSLVELDFNSVPMDNPAYDPKKHVFPGDAIPKDVQVSPLVVNGVTVPQTYTVNPNKAFVIMHKRSVPYMSAFEVGTSFFNPKSLTENHYLTFGHNTLEYLKQYPFVTGVIQNPT